MSRVVTFSRTFPAYHPKKGEKTYFVEKIWKGLYDAEPSNYIPFDGYWQCYDAIFPATEDYKENIHQHYPKYHTIRAGHRWKAGDKFSPRVWSGKPYASKMTTIAPDIEIKKVWSFEIAANKLFIDGKEITAAQWMELAKNDGLTVSEMLDWFRYPREFNGQVLCWNANLNY